MAERAQPLSAFNSGPPQGIVGWGPEQVTSDYAGGGFRTVGGSNPAEGHFPGDGSYKPADPMSPDAFFGLELGSDTYGKLS